ncbi:winged helix-turn-helix transcriptional regulator [Burkholderia pyrrocinia]|uniref:winged helix-turn-helix transcriptional regulator n=1 Tax=Burkholderia pyrrocinia TaxID=60550 RepID=UPI00215AC391|nr:winged helix-turn-helix transcriptional regulator [Burkholderia pyrrocinia]UVE68651.1 winged helix-turn-helix transcriptional regulator [Burkholderia pyrrocinia]
MPASDRYGLYAGYRRSRWSASRTAARCRTATAVAQDGFVSRTLFAEVPPRVEYALTDLGRLFLTPMLAMIRWTDEHHRAICAARRRAREREREGGGRRAVGTERWALSGGH